MAEDLVNILYEEKSKENSTTTTSNSSDAYGTWLSSLSFDPSALSLQTAAIPSLASFTSTALKFADDITSQLNVHAEIASSQVKQEFEKTRADREAQMRRLHQSRTCTLPWETEVETKAILSDHVMQQILQLPFDDRNFKEPGLPLQQLPFTFADHVPVILRMLEIDHNLKSVHAKLAPKANEEVLWRNYFKRVKYLRIRAGMDEDIAGLANLSESEAGVYLNSPVIEASPEGTLISKQTGQSTPKTSSLETNTPTPLPGNTSSSSMNSPLSSQATSGWNPQSTKAPPTTAGGRLLQELDEVISPSTPPQKSSSASIKYTTPIPLPSSSHRKEEEEEHDDEVDEIDINLEDLDLDDLDAYSDMDELDEAELEAEIERELLEDD